jgi:DNA-binding response OmpR family regulator
MPEDRRKRILVVEDEALVAMLLEDMLIDLGFEVVGPALTLEHALELVLAEPVDAAILDVNLGSCRSYPVAEEVAAKGIPFIFASGYDSPGADWNEDATVLRKPFDVGTLRAALAEMFGPELGRFAV